MGKSVFKDLIREIKGSLGRFISIMAITAIGAAFIFTRRILLKPFPEGVVRFTAYIVEIESAI